MNRVCCLALFLAALSALAAEEPKTPRTDLYGDPLPPGAVMRLGTIRLRHANADVVFSKDGKQLISCGCDGEVRVWDAATGALLRRRRLAWKPDDLDYRLSDVALSSDGATVVVSDYGRLFLFDTATGKERKRLSTRPNTPYPLLRISPDGKLVAVEDFDYPKARPIFRVWDTVGGAIRLLRLDPASRSLGNLAFAPDGKRLAGIGWTGYELFLWDALTGEVIRRPKDRVAVRGRSVAFAPDGKTLAVSARSDPIVYLLDAATWKEKQVLKAPANVRDSIEKLVFSADGRCLAGVYGEACGDAPDQQGVLLWDLAGTKKARRLPQRSNSRLHFAPDGKTLACHSASEIRLWDVATGRQQQPRPGHDWEVQTLVASPDGKTLASSDQGWRLLLWDVATGKLRHELEMAGNDVSQCRFSADGKRLVTGQHRIRDGYVLQMWDSATWKERWRFTINVGGTPLDALGISADGKRLFATVAVADEDAEKKIANPMRLQVWNADTGQVLSQRSYRMEVHTSKGFGGLGSVDISKAYRDHTIFAPDGATMSVWKGVEDVSSGQLLTSLPKGLDRPMVFSADGRFLAAAIVEANELASDGEDRKGLSLIETASGEELYRWDIGAFDYVAFTPDGRGVIAADKKSLRIWDTATGKRRYQMVWPESVRAARGGLKICSLAVLPGGRVATGMAEGDILVWDLALSTWPVGKPAADLGRRELAALWSDLAGDARKAQRAILTLAATPALAVPLLRERLEAVAELDGKRIDKWLTDLDSENYSTRETANRELAGLCDRIEPRLRRALRDRPSLEMRRRLEDILAEPRRPSAERLRMWRAIDVLERIGTPEARRILEKLGAGADAPETREAQTALQRLKRRDASANGRSSP